MENKQQTAVDWLYTQLKIASSKRDGLNTDHLFFYRLYQQAKQMEKGQQEETFKQSRTAKIFEPGMPPVWENFEQYYNETYETE